MDRKMMINWINEGTVSIPSRLIQDYKKLKLTESEVMLLIHVYSFLQQGTSFPTPEILANRMSHSEADSMQMLQSLMKRGFLELQETKDENNSISEAFSLAPLWDKLIMLSYEQKEEKQVAAKADDERTLYHLFEGEFGRPLSPMECELINIWLDQESYNPNLIKAALMESVVSGKRNLRYIDRILIEWNKNGVKTVKEAKEYGEKFRNHQYKSTTPTQAEPKKKFPSYNWLKD
ncbi:DnaD domain-containing protein [Anaerobacillus sp. CMMVII]|uniref:DnaD domain-containing protein n=1 Tax=Anaerobacillus sp. CMMVII TaxID=2755588 RepID=UPI0021B71A53|nr:DnaD domain-containing protein [Anaerobacillus sp. CMMVII]MCT8138933.1 DnaD domain-containing protein [Anaerobacillus sp. CMMVII]